MLECALCPAEARYEVYALYSLTSYSEATRSDSVYVCVHHIDEAARTLKKELHGKYARVFVRVMLE